MEDNKAKAVVEETGCEVSAPLAKRLFYHVYGHMLYNDTPCFLDMLNYRVNLGPLGKAREDYLIFKFMLRQMKKHYPSKLLSLVSNKEHAA